MNPTVVAIKEKIHSIVDPFLLEAATFVESPQFPYLDIGIGYEPFLSEEREQEQIKKLRTFYQFYYPQNPFLTEQDVREICTKHQLFLGDLPLYASEIPEVNRKEVEKFKETQFDRLQQIRKLDYLIDPLSWESEAESFEKYGLWGYFRYLGETHRSFFVEGYGTGPDRRQSVLSCSVWGSEFRQFIPITDDLYLIYTSSEQVEDNCDENYSGGCLSIDAACSLKRVIHHYTIAMVLRNTSVLDKRHQWVREALMEKRRIGGKNEGDIIKEELNEMGGFSPSTDVLACVHLPISNYSSDISFQNNLYSGGGFSFEDDFPTQIETRVEMRYSFLENALSHLFKALKRKEILFDLPSMKIIAPSDHFMRGLEEVNGYRLKLSSQGFSPGLNGNDPLILQPVPYGYLVLTQWGDDIPKTTYQNAGAN